MQYLGIDVHVQTTVWCLLAQDGTVIERGKVATTAAELTALVQRLSAQDELSVGQEVGKLCHFVHDTLTAAHVKVLSFNAHQLRMIASSRKKTDHRDAYWIAKALQTGMMPHPVYVPTGEVTSRHSRSSCCRSQPSTCCLAYRLTPSASATGSVHAALSLGRSGCAWPPALPPDRLPEQPQRDGALPALELHEHIRPRPTAQMRARVLQ
jgi:hypothetical protein